MEKLFSEFKHNSAAEWKAQLVKELKGDDYNSLRWPTDSGFVVEPFYTGEDLHQSYRPAFLHCDWDITVSEQVHHSAEQNARFLRDLNNGATAISLVLGTHQPEVVLKDIQLNYIHATFFVNPKNVDGLIAYLNKHYQLSDLQIALFPETLNSAAESEAWGKQVKPLKPYKGIKTISVDVTSYHNLNCTAAYEVAILLSKLVEHLEAFKDGELPASDVVVKTGVSSDYFMQIAKLRAIRRLWELLKNEYQLNNGIHVIAETSLTTKTVSDAYNNLLRTTTEAMAAVAGGCNQLLVSGFDVLFATNNGLAQRLAINQQLILKHESYLDKMADVACGSYYLETLTDVIASSALQLFKDIEKQGGYFVCKASGVFSTAIEKQAQQRLQAFNDHKQITIGVNKFKNEKEKISFNEAQLNHLRALDINNPALQFELNHFFTQHA